MKNASKWTMSLFLLCLAVGCASQTPATTDSSDQQSAPDEQSTQDQQSAEESACRMPLGAGDMLGARMFNNSVVQTADARN